MKSLSSKSNHEIASKTGESRCFLCLFVFFVLHCFNLLNKKKKEEKKEGERNEKVFFLTYV